VEIRQEGLEIARVYAEALLQLAEAEDVAEEALAELEQLVALLDRVPELEPLLTNPLVATADKSAMIERFLRPDLHELVVNTLEVMNQKGRLGLIRGLAMAYRNVFESARGIEKVRVLSALPLNDEQRAEIARVAGHITGHKARLEETVDESLIGGVVLYAGDQKLDLSLRQHLREAANRLAARASVEMQRGAERYVQGEMRGETSG